MSRVILDGVTKSFRGQRLPVVSDVSLTVKQGELVALVGESGCGKTTLLRIIAGFEQPSGGRVVLGEREVCNDRGGLLPEERNVGLVFQEASLFPHLSVRRNVEFGLATLPTDQKRRRGEEMLALVGLAEVAERGPHEISGGQAQRAALARALAPHPEVLLLDEPFSSMDVILKRRLIVEVRDILRSTRTTAILVTHERNDAFSFAGRIAVMRKGALLQVGRPIDLYRSPRNAYVANFLGRANMLPARKTARGVETVLGMAPEGLAAVCDGRLPTRPDQLCLTARGSGEGLEGRVSEATFLGEYTEVRIDTPHGELIVHTSLDEDFSQGAAVEVGFKADLGQDWNSDSGSTGAPSNRQRRLPAP